MLRQYRPTDSPVFLDLLTREFPEENRLLGWRPEQFHLISTRLFRWDTRLILGLLNLVRRPVVRFFVMEADGRLVGTAILTFASLSGYIGSVVVDVPYRGRGFAKRLLTACEAAAAKSRRSFAVLDVLTQNAPARHLYERTGYLSLREAAYMSRPVEHAATGPDPPLPPGIRPFHRRDGKALAAIANASLPPDVVRVLPVSPAHFSVPAIVESVLHSTSAAWVIDRGAGPLAFVRSSVSQAMVAGNLTSPVLSPDVTDPEATTLSRYAVGWVERRGAARILCEVPNHATRARGLLEQEGFRAEFGLVTMYKPLAA